MSRLRWQFLACIWSLLLAAGCATGLPAFQSGLTATATITTSAYRAADDYDAKTQPTFTQLTDFQAYKAKRDKAMKVLATVADAVRTGYAATVAADAAKRKDWPALTVTIIAAGIQVVDAFNQWGVKIPGVQ